MCYNVNLRTIHLRRRLPDDPAAIRSARVSPPEGASMAIYRVMYYSTVTVGSGGRITIPQEMRDDLEREQRDRPEAVDDLETEGRLTPHRSARDLSEVDRHGAVNQIDVATMHEPESLHEIRHASLCRIRPQRFRDVSIGLDVPMQDPSGH